MKSIMFICTGNICRSPMAHWYTQKRINDLGKSEEYLISSCGTQAIDGQESTQNAREAILEFGVDISLHRATNIYNTNIEDYNIILCMTEIQKERVIYMYPKVKDKVYTLKEYVNPEVEYKDIDDPWGLSLEVYRECSEEITKNIDILLEKI